MPRRFLFCGLLLALATTGCDLASPPAAPAPPHATTERGRNLLAQWIAQPQALVPGTAMPSMGVTPQDAHDMAAYLLELK